MNDIERLVVRVKEYSKNINQIQRENDNLLESFISEGGVFCVQFFNSLLAEQLTYTLRYDLDFAEDPHSLDKKKYLKIFRQIQEIFEIMSGELEELHEDEWEKYFESPDFQQVLKIFDYFNRYTKSLQISVAEKLKTTGKVEELNNYGKLAQVYDLGELLSRYPFILKDTKFNLGALIGFLSSKSQDTSFRLQPTEEEEITK